MYYTPFTMLTMKGVERFQNGSVHELCNLKALKTLKKKLKPSSDEKL